MKLSIKFADGSEQIVDLGPQGLKLAARRGATYHVIDEATSKTPVAATVRRVRGDLRIDDGSDAGAGVQITGFFDECTPGDRCWATFDAPLDGGAGAVPVSLGASGANGGGTVVVTQDGQSLAALVGGHAGGMTDGQVLAFGDTSHGGAVGGWGALAAVFAGTAGAFGAVAGSPVTAAAAVAGAGGAVALASTGTTDGTTRPLTIKGQIAAGPVMAGTVEVSAYDKDGNLLGSSLVDSDRGTYQITIENRGGYTGPVLLVARDANSTGGNYLDEATGRLADLGLSLAAVGAANAPTDLIVINITPITHLATLQLGIDVNAPGSAFAAPSDTAMIALVNAAVGRFFGVADILGNVVTINEVGFRTAGADAQAYGIALARLSQLDQTTGSAGTTINWLAQQLAIAGADMTAANASLDTLDTARTIARLDDLAAAEAQGSVMSVTQVNLANVAMVGLVFAMPVNAQVGDLVHVTLTGTAASVTADVYVVTAADLQVGYATVPVSNLLLNAAGSGRVVPTAIVTDAANENASPVIGARSFLSDLSPPDPVVTVAGVHGHVLTAADAAVSISVAYHGAQAGDVVQVTLDGAALGEPHVVTAAEAAAGVIGMTVARETLGADGAKLVAATILDAGGNLGVAAQVAIAIDTSVPAPGLAIKPGQDATLSAGEPGIDFEVRYAGMGAGDTVRLQVDGRPAGTAHVVTAQEAAAGVVTVVLQAESAGDIGSRNVSVVATDAAGNAGVGPDVVVSVVAATTAPPSPMPADVDAPAPRLAVRAGESGHLGLGTTDVHLEVSFDGIAVGDVVQLRLANLPLGALHVVTAADLFAGGVSFDVTRASLGADGLKLVTAVATDAAGNVGTSTPLPLVVDSLAAAPVLALAAGESLDIGAAQATVRVLVGSDDLQVGDVIAVRLDGALVAPIHFVTADDVAAGSVGFSFARAALGADGVKNLIASITDVSGNTGTSPVLPLVLDSVAPASVALTVATGEDASLNAAETVVHLNLGYAGMAAGDVVVLQADGAAIGVPHVVTAAEAAAGTVVLNVPKSDLGADGVHDVTATVTDPAGNAGTSGVLPLTVDTAGPSGVSLGVVAGEDGVLNAAETGLHLSVAWAGMAAGDVVTLNADGSALGTPHVVTAAEAAAGTVVVDVSRADLGAGEGARHVVATVADAAGNASTSPALTLTIDTVAPAAVGVSVAPGSDAHLGLGENDVRLVVGYGGMAVGDVVRLQLDGAPFGTPHTVVAADLFAGTVAFDVSRSSLGANGVKSITATATDAAGNAATSPPLSLTVDTVMSAPTLALGAGESDHLGLATSDVHLTVSAGTLAVGDVVRLLVDGSPLAPAHVVTVADVAAGGVTFDVARADLGPDGVKAVTATVTDIASNTGTSPALPLTVDTVAPAGVTLAVAAGASPLINASTTDVQVDVGWAGMAAGDVVALNLAGAPLGAPHVVTAAEAAAGVVVLDVNRAQLGADGAKAVTATATDAAGNAGTSPVLPLTVDTAAPSGVALALAPGENAFLNAAETDVHVDLTYAGMTAGDVVALHLGNGALGAPYTVTAGDVAAGQVVLDIARSALGVDGAKTITATVTDAAGNTGSSGALVLTVDSVVPSAVGLSVAAGENAVLNASETDVHLVVGYAGMAVGDVVRLDLAGAALGTPYTLTEADVAAGGATLDVGRASLGADGVKPIVATVTDVAGNVGSSAALQLTVDSVAPSSVSLAVAAGENAILGAAENGVHLTLGYAGMTAGDVVVLGLAGTPLGTPYTVTAADVANGSITLDVSRASLGAGGGSGGDGLKNVTATVTDAAGNTGSSPALALTVDTAAPSAVTLAVAPGEDALLSAAEPNVHLNVGYVGMAAGDVITLNLGGSTLGTPHVVTAADVANGGVVLDVARASLGAGDGTRSIVATITDAAGNTGSSPALALTVDTVAPVPTLAVQPGQDAHVGLGEIEIGLQVGVGGMSIGDSVRLDLGNGTQTPAHVVTAADLHAGSITFVVDRASLGADGTKNLTAVATDPAGNVGTSAPLTLTVDSVAAAPSLSIGAGESTMLGIAATDVHVTVGYANAAAGDVIQLLLDGSAYGPPYTVTATDAAAGRVTFDVPRASLGADGTHVLQADVTDAALNHGISSPLPLTVDSVAPTGVTLAVAPGEDTLLNANETGVHLNVGYAGMAAGDVIELDLAGTAFGAPYVVTAADVAAGHATLEVSRADLLAGAPGDGVKNLVVVVTDAAGNTGASPVLPLTVDTAAPASIAVAVAAGENAVLNAGESDVHLTVAYAGLAAGDVIAMTLAGAGGTALGAPYTVTAADVAAGFATVDVSRASLGADGVKSVVANVTDLAGNTGTSPALALAVDTTAPSSVTLALAAGEDAWLGAAETDVHLVVGYAGMAAGDVVTLNLGGATLGTPHVVTATEVAAGSVVLDVTRASLGADGLKTIVADVRDAAGNTGSSPAFGLTVDTLAPVPTIAPAAGTDAVVNAAESQIDLVVSDPSLHVGDVIRLRLDGADIGAAHTVTAADVAAGSVGFAVARSTLGADGTHQLVAVATDAAGNVGTSTALAVTLDTSLPQVAFSNGSASLLAGAGAGALGAGHGGVALVDGASLISDGGAVAIGRVSIALAGFVDGASERVTIGGQVLAADGSNAPATVNVAGLTWSVGYSAASHTYTFDATGAPATAAQAAALMQASYNDTAATVTDGQRVLTYVLTDAAGNPGNAVTASVLVSTTPPSIVPTITALGDDTGTAGDFVTTVATQTVFGNFSGQPDSGDRIQVSIDGATWVDATVYAAGAWYAAGITLQGGTHDLFVRAVDIEGNARVPSAQAYTLDAPVIATVATIVQVTDDVSVNGSVAGALASGVSTDDATPSLSGTVSAALASGQVVAIYDSVGGTTTRLGEATVSGTSWTFGGVTLAVGQHNLTAAVEKPASGASGTASGGFVVDEQSIVFAVQDQVGNVQGALGQGGITDDAHATVSGSIGAVPLGAGEVVAVYDGTTRLGNATLNGDIFRFVPGTALADGSHTLVAMIEDDATGNATNGRVVGTPLQFTVDTTNLPPVQTVAITSASEATTTNGSVSGSFASGTSTDGAAPTIAGTLSAVLLANQDLAVYDTVNGMATRLGTATVAGTSWSFTPSALGTGTHGLTAVVENTATGLQGTASAAFQVIEQTVAITGVADDVGPVTGFIPQNGITDDARPTIAGTLGAALGAGEAVVLYDGSTRLGTATVDGTGWTFTPTAALPDGSHAIRAMVEDDATGTATNARVVGAALNFTTASNTQAPTTTVTSFTASESTAINGSATGAFASGTSTDGTTPTFAGTTSATLGTGESLAIWDQVGGVSTRLGVATFIGTAWSFTSPALATGTHSISARVENSVNGASGAFSAPFVVIEQQLAVTALSDDVGALQGPVASGGATDDSTPTFSGTLGATLGTGEVVAVYDGATRIGNAAISGTGWSFTPATALADGAHSLRAVVQDAATGTAANGRLISAATDFTLDTSALPPTQTATIAFATESTTANGSVSGAFASGTSTDGRTPTLNGSLSAALAAGQVLAIYDGTTRLGTATVSGTAWTYTTPSLALGANSLTAVVENTASGAHGTASVAFTVVEQSLAIDSLLGLTGAANVLVGGIATVVVPTAPQLSGTLGSATLGANEVVAIYDGGTKLGNAVINGNAWGFSTASANIAVGFHTVTAMIQDASTVDPTLGRVVTQSAAFTVNASVVVPGATPQITYGIESSSLNGSKIGGFGSGESIDSLTPTVGGTVNALLASNEVLAVYDGATRLGTAAVVGQSWSFATPTLSYGVHNITAQVENVTTGSHGTASSAYVVKTQGLSAITVTDSVGAITGPVANGGITDDNRPTYSGTLAVANELDLSLENLAIYDTYNGSTLRLGYASINGTAWSFTPSTLNLLTGEQDGTHSIKAVIEPIVLGSTAQQRVVSAASTFTVDTSTGPTQLVTISAVADSQGIGGSRTGSSGSLSTIDDTTPVFSGTVSASLVGTQKVAVYDAVGGTSSRIGYATVSTTNPLQWTFEPTTPLVAGTHTLTAGVENTASGAQGTRSLGFVVTERPLTLNVMDDQGALQGNVLGFANGSGGVNVTDDTTLALNGSIGVALGLGEQVKVFDNGVALGFATVSGTNWAYTLSNATVGDHAISVQVAPLVGAATLGTGATVHVQASDVLSITSDASYSSTASAAKFTLPAAGTTLDLTRIGGSGQPAQPHIDVIDLGSTAGTVKLALADVLTGNVGAFTNANGWSGITFPGSHQMIVAGSTGTVAMTDGTWTAAGTATHAGQTYAVYEDSTHLAQLLIDTHLARTGPIAG